MKFLGVMPIGLFLTIEFLDEVVDGVNSAVWPILRSEFALTYVDIGLLLSAPVFVAHLVEPIIGLLGDVWRRWVLIVLGGLAFTTALILFAGAKDFWTLLAAMVLFYPASGTFVTLSQATLIDGAKGDEESRMVWWTVAGSIGVAAGPLVLAGALALGWSWRTVYIAIAMAALTATCLIWAVRPAPNEDPTEAPLNMRDAAGLAMKSLRDPTVLRWLVLLAAVDLMLETFVSFMALYFVDVAASTAAIAAVAIAIWTGSSLVGEASFVVLLRRFEGLRLIRLNALVVMLLFPVFMLVKSTSIKLGLLAMMGLLCAGWYSIVMAQYFRAMEGRTGIAMAVTSAVGPVQGLVPIGVGLLAESFGLQQALWVVWLAPVALILLAKTTPRD